MTDLLRPNGLLDLESIDLRPPQVNQTRALLTPTGPEERFSELNLFGHDDDRDSRARSL